jgi:hypothetical protein
VGISPTKKKTALKGLGFTVCRKTLGIALLYRSCHSDAERRSCHSDAERGGGICDTEELCVHNVFGQQTQL